MIKKIIYICLLILSFINIYLFSNPKTIGDYKIYTIRSTYNYIYDSTRTYYLNYYINEHLANYNYKYYLEQTENTYSIEIASKTIIGHESLLNENYLNVSISFYLPKPLTDFSETYLILENDNLKYRLDVGYFYTYYQKDYNYFNYDYLEGIYDGNNLSKIRIKSNNLIDEVMISPNIETTLIKNYEGYEISLTHLENVYLYKTYLVIKQNNIEYLVDCPRFKTNNLSLLDNANFLKEGIFYA